MSEITDVINGFGDYSSWLSTLEDMDEGLWLQPISDGKWSVGVIIAHIKNWDDHLLSEVIPAVKNELGMEFPDFNTFNKKAADYAKSGVSKSKLLKEAKETRDLLVKTLHELPTEKISKPLTSNGVTHCPYTGTPYSLIYTIKEFIDHDHHHKGQIIQFQKKNNLV